VSLSDIPKNVAVNVAGTTWAAPMPGKENVSFFVILAVILNSFILWVMHVGQASTRAGVLYPSHPNIFSFFIEFRSPILIVGIAIISFLTIFLGIKRRALTNGSILLFALNSIFVFKAGILGDLEFAIFAILLLIVEFISFSCFPIFLTNKTFAMFRVIAPAPVWLIGVFFFFIVTSNLWVAISSPESAINSSQRLHGLTVNPQHLSMMLVLSLPAALYLISASSHTKLFWALCTALTTGSFFLIFLTGSRMGIVGYISVCLFYFGVRGKLLVGLCLILLLYILGAFDVVIGNLASVFIEGREDTRTYVWVGLWREFINHPILGTPPLEGIGRNQFGESFFLSAAANGGILAALLSALLLIVCLRTFIRGLRLRRRLHRENSLYVSFFISQSVGVLIVSLFEAAPLGLLAAHTMLIYIFLSTSAPALSALRRNVLVGN